MSQGTTTDPFLEKIANPIFQAILLFVAGLVVTVVAKFVAWIQLTEVSERFPWLSAASFLFLFAISNSISSLGSRPGSNYWGKSIISFVLLAVTSGGMAYLFSSLNIWEAGSYSWIYVVLSLGYLVFMGLMSFMRNIVEFAQREEWNQPRKRKR